MELYKDSTQPVKARVEDLLARMTTEEKAAQLCGHLPFAFVKNSAVDKDALRRMFPHGHGRFTQYSLVGFTDPETIARVTNEVQRYFVEETRLGIPVALQSENLCGYPAAGGTLFPSMTNVAATWRPELAREMSAVIGQESRAVGITSAMSPVIDVSRDPRWGRTYETFGEDTYLVTQMGLNYVKGMQSDKEHGVACIGKHFLGYAETQAGLNCAAARLNDRELYEIFATPFEAAGKEADLSGVMANYGEIDGLCVCANPKVARTLLRDTMGFEGMLTSDGGGVMRLWNFYHIAGSHAEAALTAKKAGVDTEIPVGAGFAQLPQYVREGQLDEALLDESVRRILTIKFAYGLFDHPYVDVDAVRAQMADQKKQALSETIARDSLVLLKNDGTLPLRPGLKVAVIGPHADSLRYPVSGYTYPAYLEMMDAMGHSAEKVSFGGMADEAAQAKEQQTENPFAAMADIFSPEDAAKIPSMTDILRGMGAATLKEQMESRFTVRYAEGCGIIGDDRSGFDEAVRAARDSDVAVLALGGNCGWFNVTGGEGKDRASLDLPGVQQQLLEAVAAAGKPVVVVLYGPGIFAVNWAQAHAAAIVQAWMPGQHAGKVVADVLDGTVNPGGKLPVTVPRHVGQVPIYYNHKVGSGYVGGADENAAAIFSGGYTDCPAAPLYPFGYGLSYTAFALDGPSLAEEEVPTDGVIQISCTVRNTGDRAGSEVVQLYTHFMDAHVTRPNKSLAGFARVDLQPGEEKRVRFALHTAQLGYYNEDMDFVVEPGRLELMLGTSAHDLPLQTAVTLTGKPCCVMGKRKYTCPVTVE